jgi:hypothetical protein
VPGDETERAKPAGPPSASSGAAIRVEAQVTKRAWQGHLELTIRG